MNAFAGLAHFDGAADDDIHNRISAAVAAQQKGRVIWRSMGGATFVQRVTPASTNRIPDEPAHAAGARTLFVSASRLDNACELAEALGIARADIGGLPEGALLRGLYERHGEAGIARCLGAFAFAHWDARARRLVLARDCLGNQPLFFHRGRDFVAFATSYNILLAIPGVPRELDELMVANFLAQNVRDATHTFYRGIERVPSRTLIEFRPDRVDRHHYWVPDTDAPKPYSRDEDYVERARELLDQAVAAAIRDTPRVAISTSGGLDSSAIAATVARLGRAERIRCYTLVPPEDFRVDVGANHYPDERNKVRALARLHPALELRLIESEGLHAFEQDTTRFFARSGHPVLASSNLGLYAGLYDTAKADGHAALVTGIAGNIGLSWTGQFSLRELIRAGAWSSFLQEWSAAARQSGQSLTRTFWNEIAIPLQPKPLRRMIHRLRGRNPDSVARFSALRSEFVNEAGLQRMWREQQFDPWFAPPRSNAAHYRATFLFDGHQFGRDSMGLFAEQHGLAMRSPLSDRRLLEFLLCVPEPVYRRNGVQRSFARRVLADRLPKEILDEHRTGAQGPDWFRRLQLRRQDIACEIDLMETSALARRMIDLPRLRGLMSTWPADEHEAEKHHFAYRQALTQAIHVGRFIRWVEGGNAGPPA